MPKQDFKHGVPMFGFLPPPSAASGNRVECVDFTDQHDVWLKDKEARGVRRDAKGNPMMTYMIGRTLILIDMR